MTCYCFSTLITASTETIPSGTTAVVIEKFGTSSDVSHALYVPSGLTAAPPHVLYFKNGSTYWVIHPDHVTLEAAGAPPVGGGDCAPAMQNVLTYFSAVGRVVLKLWARDYLLNSGSSAPALANSGFTIIGQGSTVSRLIVPYSPTTSTSTALAVQFTDSFSQYVLRDFSVLATGASVTTGPGNCGTAIAMTFGTNVPPRLHSGIVEHLHIAPLFDTNNEGYSYFGVGLDLSGTPYPVVFDTWICGCDGEIAHDNYTDSSPRYAAQFLLKIDNCYDPHIFASSFWHAKTGVSYNCTLPQVQAFMFADNEIEGVQTGLYIRHNQECPDGQIRNNFCQFRNIGLDIGNVAKWRVTGGTSRIEGSAPFAYDMQFLAADNIMVTGHTFESHEPPPVASNLRVNIYIDAETMVNDVNHGKNFLIDTNIFGDLLDQPFAASAIQTYGNTQNIQIGASNAFIGPFGGSIVNDPVGSVVTLAGYPSTSTTYPPAVLPNGTTSTGIPTLGTDANPWLTSASFGHYLPGSPPILTNPVTGWVIYTDSTNRLVAKYMGNVPVPLATP